MFRQIALCTGLLIAAGLAQASEAGRIVFVAGDVRVGQQAIAHGQAIAEGDEIATGADGYAHLKTIDNGVLILRPNSRARVIAYRVDTQEPQNTRIKLELLDGVARSISGDAARQAPQNYRFNTPVAAIGIRGTDFTVFATQDTTRVSVTSGGVVVSGFDGPCTPQGGGPCEGATSRELFAGQPGNLLQVRSGQPVPQLLRDATVFPGAVPAAGASAPASKNGAQAHSSDNTLNPQMEAKLVSGATLAPTEPAPTPTPLPSPHYQPIAWGRWQALAVPGDTVDIATLAGADGRILAVNSHYALGRGSGAEWPVPTQGVMTFALNRGEAYILNGSGAAPTAATLENSWLQIDFGKAAFATGFDLISAQGERFSRKAVGDVAANGQLLGASQFSEASNMNVSGAVSAGTAAYIFQSRLDELRQAVGGLGWIKK